ncbi:hypothetical protein Btru_038623 [Bulinus truncatus]|nr:hypothetical protein Btru_038623 [Bulinus truncatus]
MNTVLSSDEADSESSLMIVEENLLVQPNLKLENISTVQKQNNNVMECSLSYKELNLDTSIEVARKSSETLRHSARGLDCTPLVELAASDDDSFPNFPLFPSKKKDVTLSEQAWVTVSSDSKGTKSYNTDTESNRKTMSSKYTYSFVSTYTDGTASSKGSSTDKLSPHVFMKKHCPLNSTTYRNKDDIGTVQFPDSISPVVDKCLAIMCIPDSSSKNNHKEQIKKWKHHETHEQDLNQKCSTHLFVSVSSSKTNMFHSLDLSEIREVSQTKVPQEKLCEQTDETTRTERTHINCITLKPDQHHLHGHVDKVQQKKEFLCSTPHSDNAALILDLSPIKSPVFEDSELPINFSVEVNTDEIIVPSLEQSPYIDDRQAPQSIEQEKGGNENGGEKVLQHSSHLCSLNNCVDKGSTKCFNQRKHEASDHGTESDCNAICEQLNISQNKNVSCEEFKTKSLCGCIKHSLKSSISSCAPVITEIIRTDTDKDSKLRHEPGSEEVFHVESEEVNEEGGHVVEQQTQPKEFGGCSKCFGFLNNKYLCFVSKLCACSQAELKHQ